MVYQSGTEYRKPSGLPHAIRSMPRWKWRLLFIGLVIGCIGVAGQAVTYFRNANVRATQPAAQQSPTLPSSGGAASAPGFVSPQRVSPVSPDAEPSPSSPSPAGSRTWSPFMIRVGFSLFVGILAGVIFRAFLRTALILSGLLVAGAMALSYFHVITLDATAVKAETVQATGWLTAQAYLLRDMLFHTLPSSTAAGIGFLLGLKRR
jgi:uncharacterized membrane protein (Fun14 family)